MHVKAYASNKSLPLDGASGLEPHSVASGQHGDLPQPLYQYCLPNDWKTAIHRSRLGAPIELLHKTDVVVVFRPGATSGQAIPGLEYFEQLQRGEQIWVGFTTNHR